MRILTSAVCDHAAATPDGKLNLHGIFHDLYAPGFPARQDRMTLVLSLEWDRSDAGRHSFRVDVRGPDGRPTLTVEGSVRGDPQARRPAAPPHAAGHAARGCGLPRPGTIRIRSQGEGQCPGGTDAAPGGGGGDGVREYGVERPRTGGGCNHGPVGPLPMSG